MGAERNVPSFDEHPAQRNDLPDYFLARAILIWFAPKRFAPLVVVLFPNLAARDRPLFLWFKGRVSERLRRNFVVALCHCRRPFHRHQLSTRAFAGADPESNMNVDRFPIQWG